ncbi:DegT/DnrJ/EryC1/StrS family aminotransferase [Variovorax ginsengisoli]|uniref:DegT/DnrJ/EryC1/StrS family aminotransferase n=1 Tax=Variovorax ginsengisoli TaxID=363844 RepID=A0ABT8SCS1_9BURK|nr:DegT/DnrJ/EryC1/StrS family aminotransferase [Variovorax ginsengisoli]MDN8617540.1 DegT/DnrJ/EryC1/StrS family aminotransferase [Variovorax ginsengisoli]MDO1536710.1 DegT/DnrJ/EryC1/StrS family aminotransferase [Variovorax ginsengisoli]
MIPLFSASAVNAGIDLEGAAQRVLRSHWYVLGEEVKAFEREFAQYTGTTECVSLANGTDALELALRALGVTTGDRVACVANAGFYGSTAIHAVGATPVYVDIQPETQNMAADSLAYALERKPKAVIVTHLYGQMADIDVLKRLTHDAGAKLIEDCAQAHGAMRDGRRVGSFGDIACFSFYPTKNLGAIGDGGAVTCDDAALADRVRTLRQYGWSAKYHVGTPGGRNSRLDELQAAVLRAKLPHLDAGNRQRRAIAARYNAAFQGLPIGLPPSIGDDYVGHLYVVRCKEREAFRAHLSAQGVSTDVHYPVPDHLQAAYPAVSAAGSLDASEAASREVVTLPCFPGLADADVAAVVAAVGSFFNR